MADRRLYDSRSFEVKEVQEHPRVWHLLGTFVPGAIKSQQQRVYRIRVAPDPRWVGVMRVRFHADRIYECESIARESRRHVYGSGRWYISPHVEGPRSAIREDAKTMFSFEEFDVTAS